MDKPSGATQFPTAIWIMFPLKQARKQVAANEIF